MEELKFANRQKAKAAEGKTDGIGISIARGKEKGSEKEKIMILQRPN